MAGGANPSSRVAQLGAVAFVLDDAFCAVLDERPPGKQGAGPRIEWPMNCAIERLI